MKRERKKVKIDATIDIINNDFLITEMRETGFAKSGLVNHYITKERRNKEKANAN